MGRTWIIVKNPRLRFWNYVKLDLQLPVEEIFNQEKRLTELRIDVTEAKGVWGVDPSVVIEEWKDHPHFYREGQQEFTIMETQEATGVNDDRNVLCNQMVVGKPYQFVNDDGRTYNFETATVTLLEDEFVRVQFADGTEPVGIGVTFHLGAQEMVAEYISPISDESDVEDLVALAVELNNSLGGLSREPIVTFC